MRLAFKFCVLAFALGTALAWYRAPWWLCLVTVSFALVAIVRHYRIAAASLKISLLAVFFVLLGFINLWLHDQFKPQIQLQPGQSLPVEGLVSEMPKKGAFGSLRVLLQTKEYGKILLSLKPSALKPAVGDEIKIRGRYVLPKNTESFRDELYLRSQGINLKLKGAEVISLQPSQTLYGNYLRLIGELQLTLTNIHKLLLPPQKAALMQAMLIGRSTGEPLSRELWLLGQNLGVVHIFAASALNLSALTLFLNFILRLCRVPRYPRYAVLILSTTFYATLAGWIPSIARAWFMANTVLVGSLIGRRADLLGALFVGTLLTLLCDPNTVGDLGFQFSYLATLGILLWTKQLVRRLNFMPGSWAEPVAVTLTAQSLILPLQLWYFHSLPLYSVVANLLAVPLANLMLILGLLASLLSAFGPLGWFLASIVELGASLNIDCLTWWLEALASLPAADFKLPNINLGWVLWLYALSLGLGFYARSPLTKHWLMASASCLLLWSSIVKTPDLTFRSISKRWYEGLLVSKNGRSQIFVCHGLAGNYPSERLVKDLQKLSVNKIDWWVGDCKPPPNIEIKRQVSLNRPAEFWLDEKLMLKIREGAVLIVYKELSALVLFKPLTSLDKGDFYSFVKLAYDHKSAGQTPWTELPKGQLCLMPHLAKTERPYVKKFLNLRCEQVLDHLELKESQIKTDGKHFKILRF